MAQRQLTTALAVVHVAYGVQRLCETTFEHYRFVDVLALDDAFLGLFGAAQGILGLLLLSRREVRLSLCLGMLLNVALLVASMSLGGVRGEQTYDDLRRSMQLSGGWVVIHGLALWLES